jgi:hypothetical protein
MTILLGQGGDNGRRSSSLQNILMGESQGDIILV